MNLQCTSTFDEYNECKLDESEYCFSQRDSRCEDTFRSTCPPRPARPVPPFVRTPQVGRIPSSTRGYERAREPEPIP